MKLENKKQGEIEHQKTTGFVAPENEFLFIGKKYVPPSWKPEMTIKKLRWIIWHRSKWFSEEDTFIRSLILDMNWDLAKFGSIYEEVLFWQSILDFYPNIPVSIEIQQVYAHVIQFKILYYTEFSRLIVSDQEKASTPNTIASENNAPKKVSNVKLHAQMQETLDSLCIEEDMNAICDMEDSEEQQTSEM